MKIRLIKEAVIKPILIVSTKDAVISTNVSHRGSTVADFPHQNEMETLISNYRVFEIRTTSKYVVTTITYNCYHRALFFLTNFTPLSFILCNRHHLSTKIRNYKHNHALNTEQGNF
ncbi:unnamed protein product [Lactuca virosa]|uniref:Uncharacterized protein n=1 Tax=Lactuca virosa TaxID=75947 RepID=A0AAU9MPF1_9ASTR|nr:unnamed protein product [Lactuca virosa]